MLYLRDTVQPLHGCTSCCRASMHQLSSTVQHVFPCTSGCSGSCISLSQALFKLFNSRYARSRASNPNKPLHQASRSQSLPLSHWHVVLAWLDLVTDVLGALSTRYKHQTAASTVVLHQLLTGSRLSCIWPAALKACSAAGVSAQQHCWYTNINACLIFILVCILVCVLVNRWLQVCINDSCRCMRGPHPEAYNAAKTFQTLQLMSCIYFYKCKDHPKLQVQHQASCVVPFLCLQTTGTACVVTMRHENSPLLQLLFQYTDPAGSWQPRNPRRF